MTHPQNLKDDFLHWAEFRVLPDCMFQELKDYDGGAFEHMFACMTFMVGGKFDISMKHLRKAIEKDGPTIGRMAEIGALQATSMTIYNKRLMEVLYLDNELETVLRKFSSGEMLNICRT